MRLKEYTKNDRLLVIKIYFPTFYNGGQKNLCEDLREKTLQSNCYIELCC